MIHPKTPRSKKWKPALVPGYLASEGVLGYRHGDVLVFSQVQPMKAPDGSGDVLPTWLVSVSERGLSMPTDATMNRVRRAFGMERAEEDNHESGIARKLFMVVDPARRVECECKITETVIERPDGYRYSVSTEKESPDVIILDDLAT